MKISRRKILISSALGALTLFGNRLASSLFKKNFGLAWSNQKRTQPAQAHPQVTVNPRVVSIHASGACHWDGASYPYVDGIDYQLVAKMLDQALMTLATQTTPEHAWQSLFSSYRKGDRVAIKPNFNDLYNEFRDNLVTSPAVLNAILAGLVGYLGVPPTDIFVYDCTRKIPDSFRQRINYPVHFVEAWGSCLSRKIQYKIMGNPLPKADLDFAIKMSKDIKNENGKPIQCYLPKVITQAQHIINVPIMKSHQFVLASGALKNHYGTVRFSDGITGPIYLHPPVIHESIVDINNHPQIKQKTRLIVMDALFGRTKKSGGPPDKWQIFNNANPARLYVSQDPVALDSVTANFIRNELRQRRQELLADEYLRLAAAVGLGVHEMPVGDSFQHIDFQELTI